MWSRSVTIHEFLMFCLTILPLIVWFEIDFMRQNIKMVSESSMERIILKRTFVLLFILYDNVVIFL